MVRSLSFSTGISARFWSAALVHAVYLKGKLWHSAIEKTPYETWTGFKPDHSHLRMFGALFTARKPGKQPKGRYAYCTWCIPWIYS